VRTRTCRLLVLLTVLISSLPAATPHGTTATVIHVVDGDTLNVRIDTKKENVRLIGVDTPEMNFRSGQPEPFALESTLFTREQVEGQAVTLTPDALNNDRDRYKRLLRYVYKADGTFLNLELVERGYGFALLAFPFKMRDRFAAAEIEAREAGRGLWAHSRIATVGFEEAPSHEGLVVAARGRIVTTKTIDTRSSGKLCFLNFHTDYKTHLSVVVREPDFHRFGGDPGARYLGRKVTVTGRVRSYRSRPQIEVIDPGQIVVHP